MNHSHAQRRLTEVSSQLQRKEAELVQKEQALHATNTEVRSRCRGSSLIPGNRAHLRAGDIQGISLRCPLGPFSLAFQPIMRHPLLVPPPCMLMQRAVMEQHRNAREAELTAMVEDLRKE